MSTVRARLMRRARRYLSIWKENIGLDNELGLTDINHDAEDFCCGLLNIVLDARLQNLNLLQMNFPAVDLADPDARICVQVTSTAGAEKITHTLDKFFANGLHGDYDRVIVMILGKKKNYRTEFPQQEGFRFDPARDIWDITKLLTQIAGLDMARLNRVDAYLREQFDDLEELTPPMDLPVLSALDDFSFLGRETELAEITRRFDQGEKLVFLSGLGGMGKTELAARFAATRWGGESYFAHFTESWRRTVLESIAPHIPDLNREGADEDRIFRDAMTELKGRSAEELLILDNVDQEEATLTQLRRELSVLDLHILVTTRTDAERAVNVDRLHRAELHQLFRQHDAAVTQAEQDALIDAVSGHTLTVDLMARALRPRRGAATAEKLLHNLADSTIRKVDTAYPGGPAQAKIIEHLKAVFRVVNLDEAKQELLRCATLLPSGGMDDELFLSPFDEERQDDLDSLIDNGWLSWKDGLLSIHPVIRKVCQEELEPSDESCGQFLNALIDQYDEKDFQLDRCRQMAELLTTATTFLDDPQGRWALKAGERWRDVGEYEKELDCGLRAIEQSEKNLSPDDPDLAWAYNNVGIVYGSLGDFQKSLDYALKAMAIRQTALSPDDPDLAKSYNNVGYAYGTLGNHQKALEYKLKAVRIFERVLNPYHPDLATSYSHVGGTYNDLGDHRMALKFNQKALVIREKVLPPEHPDRANSYISMGFTYDNLGDYQTALKYNQKALTIWEKVLPPEHPDLALSYNNVGCTYDGLGDHRTALEYEQKALTIREKVLPPEHPDLASSYNNVGNTYGNLGDHQTELEYKQRALAIWEKALLPEHPLLATSCNNVAWTYYGLGNLAEAARHMRRAADIIHRSSLPENHPDRLNYPKWADRFEKELKMQQAIQQTMAGFGASPLDRFRK